MKVSDNFFKSKYFPSAIIQRNKLHPDIRKKTHHRTRKKGILEFIRSSPQSTFAARLV